MTRLLLLTAANIKLCVNKPKQAIELIKRASLVLTITRGEQHSLLQEYLKPLSDLFSTFDEQCSN